MHCSIKGNGPTQA